MPRKRRGAREVPLVRVNVELYPEEQLVLRRAKAAAAMGGKTFREWVVEAMQEKADRERPNA